LSSSALGTGPSGHRRPQTALTGGVNNTVRECEIYDALTRKSSVSVAVQFPPQLPQQHIHIRVSDRRPPNYTSPRIVLGCGLEEAGLQGGKGPGKIFAALFRGALPLDVL